MGKFANPFEHVELVFHNDVQSQGSAQQFRLRDVGFIDQVQLNFGQFVLDEVKTRPDTNLFAGQLEGFHFKIRRDALRVSERRQYRPSGRRGFRRR